MAGWDQLKELVRIEILQRHEEGYDMDGMHEAFEEVLKSQALQENISFIENQNVWMDLYSQVCARPMKEGFSYVEPSELDEIFALTNHSKLNKADGENLAEKQHAIQALLNLDKEVLADRFYGAWLGRSAGCALGKPLEHMDFLVGKNGIPGWKMIEHWFREADAWPIKGYTPMHSPAAEKYDLQLTHWSPNSVREKIQFMESDDDIRYMVLALLLMEEKGINFDSWDVGKHWHNHLSYNQVCTAETQAYLNFAQVTFHISDKKSQSWDKERIWVRNYLNPYREWIGAQIRVDVYGYIAAGQPKLAAELAWRDASFSHEKNGIYGAMFVAAMTAAAFTESDIERVIEAGLAQIPTTSRLYEAIVRAIDIAKHAQNTEELFTELWAAYGHYDPVHTINNAALVTAALIYAKGDFEQAIVIAVSGGWDTDCNGATVGSIMGIMLGGKQLPANWIDPLNDTLYAEIRGFHPIKISTCAERTHQLFLRENDNLI